MADPYRYWEDMRRHPRGHRHGPGHGHGPRGDAWAEFWSEWWRGPAPRAERGVVRYLILDAIRTQPRHGYEIIQAIVDRTNGSYRPSPGVIYPTLQMLEEMRLAKTVEKDDRKVYEITEAGKKELSEHTEEVEDFYDGHEDASWDDRAEDVKHVMKRVGQVIKAFRRGARRGHLGPAKMRKLVSILDETLEKLDTLLTEDE